MNFIISVRDIMQTLGTIESSRVYGVEYEKEIHFYRKIDGFKFKAVYRKHNDEQDLIFKQSLQDVTMVRGMEDSVKQNQAVLIEVYNQLDNINSQLMRLLNVTGGE